MPFVDRQRSNPPPPPPWRSSYRVCAFEVISRDVFFRILCFLVDSIVFEIQARFIAKGGGGGLEPCEPRGISQGMKDIHVQTYSLDYAGQLSRNLTVVGGSSGCVTMGRRVRSHGWFPGRNGLPSVCRLNVRTRLVDALWFC